MDTNGRNFIPIHINAGFPFDSLSQNVEFSKTVDNGLLELLIKLSREKHTKRR